MSRSRDSIKSSRIAHFRYTAKAAFVALKKDFMHCSQVARGPEAKRRKNQAAFLNRLVRRWAAVWPCVLFLGSANGVGLR